MHPGHSRPAIAAKNGPDTIDRLKGRLPDDKRLNRLKAEAGKLLHHEEDQILFVSLGPEDSSHGLRIEAMGLPYLVRSRVTIV